MVTTLPLLGMSRLRGTDKLKVVGRGTVAGYAESESLGELFRNGLRSWPVDVGQ